MKQVAILIDGGFLRVLSRKAGKVYNPNYIEKVALACVESNEELFRVLYYDCAPYNGTQKLPVSGTEKNFNGSDQWLHDLGSKDHFAVRLGVLKFRGFKPTRQPSPGQSLTDQDFKPDFEQKGVDMRIGLDIASYSERRMVDRIILISNDTDCIPAMKHGRKAGLQVILVKFPNSNVASELLAHTDLTRYVTWPT
jgi:uncharacterized LabA/DUF88 family protein